MNRVKRPRHDALALCDNLCQRIEELTMSIVRICMCCGAKMGIIDCVQTGISHGVCPGECERLLNEWIDLSKNKYSLTDYVRLHRMDKAAD